MATSSVRNEGRARSERTGAAEAAPRYEPLDVPAMLPFWLGALIAGFIVLVLVGITIGYPLADRQEYRGPLKALPPAPRLESAPVRARDRYDAAKQRELQTHQIAAAMRARAQQGWGPPK